MHTVEIIDDELIVMDDDGQVGDVENLTSDRAAKRTVNAWARVYTIESAAAYHHLVESFRSRGTA